MGDGAPEPVVLGVAVSDALRLAVAVAEPLLDALRRLATLSPRYVSRAMTAPGASLAPPPPPPAASHSSADSRSPLAMALEGTSCVTLTSR